MKTDAPEPSRRARSIYEGREPAGRLFRRGGRDAPDAGGPSRSRPPRPPFSMDILFLALVAIYAIASTAYIVHRHRALAVEARSKASHPVPAADSQPEGRGDAQSSAGTGDRPAGDAAVGVVRRICDGNREIVDLVRDADRMIDRGLVTEALARIDRRLASAPGNLDLRLRKAGIERTLGRMAAARDGFVAVLESDPSRIEAREGLAAVLLELKDPEGALDAAQWVLEVEGHRPESLRVAARAAVDLGQYAVALGHMRLWVQQEPESVEAQDLLGLCQLRLGEYGKAAFQLGALIRKGKGTEATYLNLVLAYAQQKQSNDVADLLMKAVQRLDRARVVAWFGRPDFAVIREDPTVAAVASQIIEGVSPGLSLHLPEIQREGPSERGIGMTPAPDLGTRPILLKR